MSIGMLPHGKTKKEAALQSIGAIRATLALASATFGLALAGCGGGDDTTTTVTKTVTVPKPGITDVHAFSGCTSQELPISFAASPKAVLTLSFDWRARCEDGQVHRNTIRLGGAPIQGDSFVIDGNLTTGGVAHVEGTMKGNRATGHLSRSEGSS